jgi:CheY-like chemotaxis protein
MRVLVVDDNQAAARSAATLLRPYGYAVDVALNGEEALRQAARFAPDVVLLDLTMPGMDGCEVAKRLVAPSRGKPPFVVAVTGRGGEEERGQALAAGIDLHLVKPVSLSDLLRVLGNFQAMVWEG